MNAPQRGESGAGIEVLEGWLIDPESIPEAPSAPELLAAILDDSPDPVLIFNARAQPLLANAMARRFWPGGKLTKSLPKALLANVRRVHETGQPYHRRRLEEMVAVSSREGTRYMLPSIFPAGNLVVAMLRDETAWELSVRIRNNLFSSISHELKTPLTSARVSLYLLAEQRVGELNKIQSQLVESAKNDLDREILAIRNLLDLIRTEGHQETVDDAEAVSLQSLVRESLNNLDKEVSRLDLTVSINFHSQDLPIPLDRETARLVVHQMLSAPIRDAGPETQIHITADSNADKARLEVEASPEKTSPGLPGDLFGLPLESDAIRGLGATALGLRFAHELVRTEGGSIHFREAGNPSALVFEFPLSEQIPAG
ncbi:MAG TPA: HAMP domain-containing sensor histidine kinase [Oceanipulchritudo sp.]|nr:HAMP domain-containing sensor histidine kinase [Oceanipulchritudo sp.]